MQKKTLHGIKPYNDCWFRSCYFHQLIAGMRKFGVPKEYTLLDYGAEIIGCDSWETVEIKEDSVLTEEEYRLLTGVEIVKYNTDNITADVIKSINADRPIIVGQDNFFTPYRPEYDKVHCSHFVLVYGYDAVKQSFTIMEHSFASGLDYIERTVLMKDVAAAYEGFSENFMQFSWSVAELKKIKNAPAFACRQMLANKLCKPLADMRINKFMRPYELLSQPIREEWLTKIIETAAFLQKHFRVLMMQYKEFCGDENIITHLENMWRLSNFVQGVAGKAYCKNMPDLFRSDALKERIANLQSEAKVFEKAVKESEICRHFASLQ